MTTEAPNVFSLSLFFRFYSRAGPTMLPSAWCQGKPRRHSELRDSSCCFSLPLCLHPRRDCFSAGFPSSPGFQHRESYTKSYGSHSPLRPYSYPLPEHLIVFLHSALQIQVRCHLLLEALPESQRPSGGMVSPGLCVWAVQGGLSRSAYRRARWAPAWPRSLPTSPGCHQLGWDFHF